MAIPIILLYCVRKRHGVPFRHLLVLFGAFIVLCGFTHFMEVVAFYKPLYRFDGLLKLVTAAVSWGTVVALIPIVPKALAMRTPDELEREIAERKRIEAALQEAHDQLERRVAERTAELTAANGAMQEALAFQRALLDSANYAIFSTSPEGVVCTFNAAAEHLLGYSAAEVVGKTTLAVFYDQEEIVQRARELSQALGTPIEAGFAVFAAKSRRGKLEEREWTCLRKDGTRFPMLLSVTAIRNSTGDVTGFMCIGSDITENKRAQEALALKAEELARSNTDLEQFAYVASHDLQEPLRMVASYVELIGLQCADRLNEEGKEYLAFAVEGAVRMQTLINDLLAYSRVGNRGSPMQLTDCRKVMDNVLTDLRLSIMESNALVTYDCLPTVVVDATQLGLLFRNLIANALKFRREAPRVHITAQQVGPEWVFSVQDNGIGIASRHRERIFMIFQRLHSRSKYPGTGIGLAVCKRVVERHGGRIWVESLPGEGSIFHFTLPERKES